MPSPWSFPRGKRSRSAPVKLEPKFAHSCKARSRAILALEKTWPRKKTPSDFADFDENSGKSSEPRPRRRFLSIVPAEGYTRGWRPRARDFPGSRGQSRWDRRLGAKKRGPLFAGTRTLRERLSEFPQRVSLLSSGDPQPLFRIGPPDWWTLDSAPSPVVDGPWPQLPLSFATISNRLFLRYSRSSTRFEGVS